VSYMHTDALGTVVAVSDDVGTVTDTYEYEPFGKVVVRNGISENSYQFVGSYGVRDVGHKKTIMGVRLYDQETGRFVQKDPIGLKGGDANFMRYAANRPINLIDPTGLVSCMYQISTHTLFCINNSGTILITNMVQSGNGSCLNNPKCANKSDKGPLPTGEYDIKPPGWSSLHPTWMYLDPATEKQMHGREGMFIHPGTKSAGCLVMGIGDSDYSKLGTWVTQEGGTLRVSE